MTSLHAVAQSANITTEVKGRLTIIRASHQPSVVKVPLSIRAQLTVTLVEPMVNPEQWLEERKVTNRAVPVLMTMPVVSKGIAPKSAGLVVHPFTEAPPTVLIHRTHGTRWMTPLGNILEYEVQQRLQVETKGGHQTCIIGIPDIVTSDKIIEIKRWKGWMSAMGQLLAYSDYFPDRQLQVHFFGSRPNKAKIAEILRVLGNRGIIASEEVFSKGTRVTLMLSDTQTQE